MPDIDKTIADLMSLESSEAAFTDAQVDAAVDDYLGSFGACSAVERTRLADEFKRQAPGTLTARLILALIRRGALELD